jgi:hypothetical protein
MGHVVFRRNFDPMDQRQTRFEMPSQGTDKRRDAAAVQREVDLEENILDIVAFRTPLHTWGTRDASPLALQIVDGLGLFAQTPRHFTLAGPSTRVDSSPCELVGSRRDAL